MVCNPVLATEIPGSNVSCATLNVRDCLTVGGQEVGAGMTVNNIGGLILASIDLPTETVGPLNNYAPVGTDNFTVFRFMASGPPGTIVITGLDLGAPGNVQGRVVVFVNRLTSSKSLTFNHQDVGSNPTNRFVNGSLGGPRVIGAGGCIAYRYDVGGTPRWMMLLDPSL
jgi:hypothetical protein